MCFKISLRFTYHTKGAKRDFFPKNQNFGGTPRKKIDIIGLFNGPMSEFLPLWSSESLNFPMGIFEYNQ